jgi:hypothetical protein
VVTPEEVRALEPACAWRSADLADGYVWVLDDAEVAELDEALRRSLETVADVLDVGRDDFPLPTLGPKLAALAVDLIDGRGVALLRGVPRHRYSADEMARIYWGVGTYLGVPWPQNAKGHLLGDVTDQGKAADDPTSRGNEIGGVEFPFHSDGSDLVGLCCLDPGVSGGASLVANAVTIHNDLVAADPEAAAALYDSFAYDFRGEQVPGHRPWYEMPVFTERKGRLFVRYIRPYIRAAARHADAPRPSEPATRAMDAVDAMCADPAYHLSMDLEPGDMQFVDNYHVLHARRAYVDDRAAGKVRHLKRLWLETGVLTDDDKPEAFRLSDTSRAWRAMAKKTEADTAEKATAT